MKYRIWTSCQFHIHSSGWNKWWNPTPILWGSILTSTGEISKPCLKRQGGKVKKNWKHQCIFLSWWETIFLMMASSTHSLLYTLFRHQCFWYRVNYGKTQHFVYLGARTRGVNSAFKKYTLGIICEFITYLSWLWNGVDKFSLKVVDATVLSKDILSLMHG